MVEYMNRPSEDFRVSDGLFPISDKVKRTGSLFKRKQNTFCLQTVSVK
ncbi:hypothetical protein l11_07270 [Neisseria weaveri LMG 5135]|nr:hypothetical protein l13_21080 [Neisseria weaveri ATCC 51223]EGV37990.1 hypothetical protein l11_07270 [Neisseria weaveri LMG 5135]